MDSEGPSPFVVPTTRGNIQISNCSAVDMAELSSALSEEAKCWSFQTFS
jgi:hypothetical protein